MKTCINGLPCPIALQCGIGCFFTEVEKQGDGLYMVRGLPLALALSAVAWLALYLIFQLIF